MKINNGKTNIKNFLNLGFASIICTSMNVAQPAYAADPIPTPNPLKEEERLVVSLDNQNKTTNAPSIDDERRIDIGVKSKALIPYSGPTDQPTAEEPRTETKGHRDRIASKDEARRIEAEARESKVAERAEARIQQEAARREEMAERIDRGFAGVASPAEAARRQAAKENRARDLVPYEHTPEEIKRRNKAEADANAARRRDAKALKEKRMAEAKEARRVEAEARESKVAERAEARIQQEAARREEARAEQQQANQEALNKDKTRREEAARQAEESSRLRAEDKANRDGLKANRKRNANTAPSPTPSPTPGPTPGPTQGPTPGPTPGSTSTPTGRAKQEMKQTQQVPQRKSFGDRLREIFSSKKATVSKPENKTTSGSGVRRKVTKDKAQAEAAE